jgi:hypothetical protein
MWGSAIRLATHGLGREGRLTRTPGRAPTPRHGPDLPPRLPTLHLICILPCGDAAGEEQRNPHAHRATTAAWWRSRALRLRRGDVLDDRQDRGDPGAGAGQQRRSVGGLDDDGPAGAPRPPRRRSRLDGRCRAAPDWMGQGEMGSASMATVSRTVGLLRWKSPDGGRCERRGPASAAAAVGLAAALLLPACGGSGSSGAQASSPPASASMAGGSSAPSGTSTSSAVCWSR